jgi:hypothetical protein
MRSYSELVKLPTFEERFEYLRLDGEVGEETFGFDRYINQSFYRCGEWKRVRDQVIVRDNGCDLGISDRQLYDHIVIHHMNPVTREDLINKKDTLMDPEYLICVSIPTHNAIHYGDENQLVPSSLIERKPNDTCPWK